MALEIHEGTPQASEKSKSAIIALARAVRRPHKWHNECHRRRGVLTAVYYHPLDWAGIRARRNPRQSACCAYAHLKRILHQARLIENTIYLGIITINSKVSNSRQAGVASCSNALSHRQICPINIIGFHHVTTKSKL